MTAVVGILCSDGVVIGTDSSTTFTHGQQPTIEQRTEKLHVIEGHIIIAGTGAVGLGQRFCAIVESAWSQDAFKNAKSALEPAAGLSRATLQNFEATFQKPGTFGALLAFPIKHVAHLCEFAYNDFQPELKTERIWYCSMGSAQHITDPFLGFMRDVFWQSGLPNVYDGVFAVTWTLEQAIHLNVGGVNDPVRIAVLENRRTKGDPARLLDDTELNEHRQHIEEAKGILREHRNKLARIDMKTAPDIPRRN